MIGTTIRHYKILEKLGEGGMGVVYKAQDLTLNRTVALKFLPDRVTKDESARSRFLQEAQAAAGLNHANICTVFGVEAHEDQIFISMEYVDGGTLRDAIAKGPLTTSQCLALAIQIGEALHEAHLKGIVHRDVKADNIMLTSKGQVKVMDFGLAKLKGALKLTRTSSTVGTLGYMAPEQIQGSDVDPRSDLFSFGVLMFEMLTGKLPFRGDHEPAMMYSILNEAPESVRRYLPAISASAERILEKSLEKDPEERYQSAADMVADLKRWKRETASVATTVDEPSAATTSSRAPSSPDQPRHRSRLQRGLVAYGAGVFALLLVGAALWLRPWTSIGTPEKRSLAVLPFDNQGDPEREYFADGIAEEITTRLSSLSGIAVIARSSAWQYKGTTRSVKEVGDELGIDYLLTGTVRWSRGDDQQLQVRVSPALVDIHTGIQVWANTFDAPFQNAFALQSDIAQQVARALDISLGTGEASALEQKLTTNAEAYDSYLQGIEYENRSPSKADGDIAINQFEHAIALDPNFAAAYARLGISHARQYWFFYDRTKERVAKAAAAAEKALALNPRLSASHEAIGWYRYHTKLDYDEAIASFNKALELQPNNPTVAYGLAAVYRRKGDLEESLRYWRSAVEADPRASELERQWGETLMLLRRYEEADAHYAASMRLAPDNVSAYGERAKTAILWKGDLRAARSFIDDGFRYGRMDSGEDQGIIYMKYLALLFEGDLAGAQQALELFGPSGGQSNQFMFYPQALLKGRLQLIKGNQAEAERSFRQAAALIERRLQDAPEDERLHSSLGIAYAGLGRKQDAIRFGERAVTLLPVEKELWRGGFRMYDLAEIYARTGERDRAVDILERLVTMPSEVSGTWLRLDPQWKSLRGHQRFDMLLKKHQ